MSDIPNTPDEDQPSAKAVADAELRRLGLDPADVVSQPEWTREEKLAAIGPALAELKRYGIEPWHLHAIVPAIEALGRAGVLPLMMALRAGHPKFERAP